MKDDDREETPPVASQLERTREQLVRANLFLDSIIENIPAMIFVKDAEELRFERFNRAGEELLGMKRSELLGKNDYDFFPPEQAEFFQREDRATLASGTLRDIPEEPIQTAGGERWLHTKKIPILDAEGHARFLLGISEDITEEKKTRADLRKAHEDLKRANDELERRVLERTAQLTRTNELLATEIRLRARTVDHLRRTEQQLQHSQKMDAIGRLAGGVAHDFNNMLSVILTSATLAMADVDPGATVRLELDHIKAAAARAAALTRQLLAFSRNQVVQPKAIDLNVTIRDLEGMLRRLIGEDIVLATELAEKLELVRADAGQVGQVIVNLVVNARDAMPAGGKILIATRNVELEDFAADHPGMRPGAYVLVAISDTGKGMDPGTQSRIFEPFFTTKGLGEGTGLGLSTVYGIVKQCGGSIWVDSRVGGGSRFSIYLPRIVEDASPREAKMPSDAPLPAGAGDVTVLLVEDEDLVRASTARVLRRAGYDVIEAHDGEEALRVARDGDTPIHLLLTDMIMPGIRGNELGERFVAIRPEVKVLCMSGYSDTELAPGTARSPGAAFLEKPFTPAELLRIVEELLRER